MLLKSGWYLRFAFELVRVRIGFDNPCCQDCAADVGRYMSQQTTYVCVFREQLPFLI